MSKIIIHNKSFLNDQTAAMRVAAVISMGFRSGPNQYTWGTTFPDCEVISNRTSIKAKTYTFKVVNKNRWEGV